MKTSKYFKTIAICAVMLAAALPGKAQLFPKTYINIDWQVGVPLGADFADKTSGWGMNFEGGYFVTPAITVGPFISYQTNLQSISRQTLDLGGGSALTTVINNISRKNEEANAKAQETMSAQTVAIRTSGPNERPPR